MKFNFSWVTYFLLTSFGNILAENNSDEPILSAQELYWSLVVLNRYLCYYDKWHYIFSRNLRDIFLNSLMSYLM